MLRPCWTTGRLTSNSNVNVPTSAIISRGRIRALGMPQTLRAEHRQSERVRLTIGETQHGRLGPALSSSFEGLEIEERAETHVITFTHEAGDSRLDSLIRAVQDNGGKILSCETERATLLEVLESYEHEQEKEVKS